VSAGYESFYLRAVDPAQPRGIWIRYTTHTRAGAPPVGSLWCTYFDAAAPGPVALKESPGPPIPNPAAWLTIGEGEIGAGFARGRAAAGGRAAAWDLEFDGAEAPLRHLPYDWMYRAPVPRTKLESRLPDTHFQGWVEIDGGRIDFSGWRGMVGHNWGAEHAERWIWLHGVGFDGAPDAWLDLAVGRARLGPLVTPWIANGALHVDGERIRLGGLGRTPEVRETPTEARIRMPGLTAHARAPGKDVVAWLYADPPGGEHHALNCSIAALDLTIERPGRAPLELSTPHGAAYELGVRERDHGIPLQPFPDG
jgi:hypothetical protein